MFKSLDADQVPPRFRLFWYRFTHMDLVQPETIKLRICSENKRSDVRWFSFCCFLSQRCIELRPNMKTCSSSKSSSSSSWTSTRLRFTSRSSKEGERLWLLYFYLKLKFSLTHVCGVLWMFVCLFICLFVYVWAGLLVTLDTTTLCLEFVMKMWVCHWLIPDKNFILRCEFRIS